MNNKKKLIIIILILVLVIGISYIAYKNLSSNYDERIVNEDTIQEYEYAPNFSVYDKNGNRIMLTDFKGKSVVINYWASWCSPCISELPFFQDAIKKYKNDDIVFLMINWNDGVRETKETVYNFIKENKYEFEVFYDTTGEIASKYACISIPQTFFIDKNGYLIIKHIGTISEEKLDAEIRTLLKRK